MWMINIFIVQGKAFKQNKNEEKKFREYFTPCLFSFQYGLIKF